MFKKVNFNIYEENLEDIVYGEKNTQGKNTPAPAKEGTDQPIPQPPPQFWKNPLNYGRLKKAKRVL